MILPYTAIPNLKQWQSDSSVLLANRKSDPILTSIDGLVGTIEHADENLKRLLVVDLFWTCDHWLKTLSRDPKLDKKREPAVYRLFATSANLLCGYFGCQINTLPNELEYAFGRTVGVHGLRVDVELGLVKYMEEAERKLYKLDFSGGKAFQFEWWSTPVNLKKKVLANSRHACDTKAFFNTNADKTDFGGFVMTMGRDLYMARHGGPNTRGSRVFHSSYFGNHTVSCAGTMLIRNGEIEKICPDSGHFQPGDVNVMALLQMLRMQQVPLERVIVQDFLGKNIGTAALILSRRDWSEVVSHMKQNQQDLKDNQAKLKSLTGPKPTGSGADYGLDTDSEYIRTPDSTYYSKTPASSYYTRTPASQSQASYD